MPEGPELARSRDFLRERLLGRTITNLQVTPGGRYANYGDRMIEGHVEFFETKENNPSRNKIVAVDVKGKFMHWTIEWREPFDRWSLWSTYGMSGRWTTEGTKHGHVRLMLSPDFTTSLLFNDPRHFGTLKFVHDIDGALTQRKLASLGPDMLNDPPDLDTFKLRLMKKPKRTVCEALMDQSCISGVGNYIKAEALYLSEISPHRKVSDLLPHSDFRRLREQIINVMKASYATGGATFRTYRQADGSKGEAQRRFVVYGNKTDPMGNPVVKEETPDGRTTHWVPAIQT